MTPRYLLERVFGGARFDDRELEYERRARRLHPPSDFYIIFLMTITVNGESREVAKGLTVADLIAQHNLSPDKVAIELNRRILRSDRYNTELKEGDQVEIVTFVGGG